jgi:hypothetical protein
MTSRLLLLPLLVLALVLPPSPAAACGGLFCDARPLFTAPVVQAGEEIVYGIEDDGSLVMTIRIAYQGTAPEFAWILPVPVEPTISLGTNALFDQLRLPTQPTFPLDSRIAGTCATDPSCEYPDSGYHFADAAARSDAGSSGGTVVYAEGTLGPYETVVLSATSGEELHTWLVDHAYLVTDEAIPLLDSYVAAGDRFVALRLRTDASVSEIQPITLHMPGVASPCLPIRLTAIATQPDLPITAYVLADARAVPTNYSVVAPDFRDAGLWNFAPSYTSYYSWVTREVDALGGQAFITDYAGDSPTVFLALPTVLDLGTSTDPMPMLSELQGRGYFNDAQLLPLLTRFIVPPEGQMPSFYFGCLLRGFGCEPPVSFDPAGLVAAIDEAITQPRNAAQALVARHPYTSRLFTTMSASEMTLDPEFRLDPALGTFSNVHPATIVIECDAAHYQREASIRLELPTGDVLARRPASAHQTPEEFCAGGWLAGHPPDASVTHYPDGALAPMDGGPATGMTPAGGGSCSVRAGHAPGGMACLFVSALALVIARRRRAQR